LPRKSLNQDVDSVEYFAGQMEVSKAMARAGYITQYFEILKNDVMMNVIGSQGLAYAILLALKLRPGGFCMLAPVCSTWVFMNRGTSGRSRACPLGRKGVKSVAEANEMVARVVLLLYIFQAKNVFWLLEQPASSVMQFHPRLQQFMGEFHIFRTHTWLGAFGGGSPKPTLLYSGHNLVHRLQRHLDRTADFEHAHLMTRKYVDGSGQKRCTGGSHLKASQAYPRGFGEAIRELYASEAHALRACPDAVVPRRSRPPVGDGWADANLRGVFNVLTGGA
jgi:hypothetical protein